MLQKKYLAEAIETLIYAWGSDTPPEAFWALKDIVKYINATYATNLECPAEDDPNLEEKINKIVEFLEQ